jgi:DeoR/GlpR family transcriptional regulator of sugar metabolism
MMKREKMNHRVNLSLRDRRAVIEDLVARGEIELTELAEEFGVSEMTIRRDLEALEEQGVLRRVVGGGAIPLDVKTREPQLMSRALDESSNKAHIGAAVARLISPGEAVFFDGGSTALAVASALRGRGLGLTVLTRSLLIAMEFADEPDTQVFMLGGRVKSGEMVTTATATADELANYNFDTYVMGISGLDPAAGLTDYDPEEGAGKRVAINQADRVILAVDHTKLGRVLLVRVAGLDDISTIVTDAERGHLGLSNLPPSVEVEYVERE